MNMWRIVAFAPGHARGARPWAEAGLIHAGCRTQSVTEGNTARGTTANLFATVTG